MQKAPRYDADALIFDLEDSVPVDRKGEARVAVRSVLDEFSNGEFREIRQGQRVEDREPLG